MFFKKKKRMIDVRELQKRGVVRIPKQDTIIPTDNEGFIEFGKKSETASVGTTSVPAASSNSELFGFMDTTSSPTSTSTNREESERITQLDNKIYKLENRIELLEKKLDIEKPSDTSVGVMGW
jgi:hypothetical protein